jgi:acyl carrier protein
MNKTTIEEIREFVGENFLLGREDTLSDDASFLDEGIIDSTGVLELVGFLEQHFEIQIDNEELTTDNLDSLAKVSAYVTRKLAVKATEVQA